MDGRLAAIDDDLDLAPADKGVLSLGSHGTMWLLLRGDSVASLGDGLVELAHGTDGTHVATTVCELCFGSGLPRAFTGPI